jgi:hypothetical protein
MTWIRRITLTIAVLCLPLACITFVAPAAQSHAASSSQQVALSGPYVGPGVPTGRWRLQVMHTGMCLDVESGSTASGAKIVQWPCHGGANQQFEFISDGFTPAFAPKPGQVYNIRTFANKVFDVAENNPFPNTSVVQWPLNHGANQKFSIEYVPPFQYETFRLVPLNNQSNCLDVSGGSLSAGAQLITFTCHAGKNQQFRFISL